jgi:hypothetical protein
MKIERHIFLMGRPPMGEALGYLSTEILEPVDINIIAEEWRKANDHVNQLTETEKNICETVEIKPMDEKCGDKIKELYESIIFKKAYGILPFEIKMVELDKLVVFQKTVNLDFIEKLKGEFPKNPDDDFLFNFCLSRRASPPVSVARLGPNAIQFTSTSNDLRFLEGKPLNIEKMDWYCPGGHAEGIFGLSVGYGPNYVNALKVGNRLILNNGMHRTYTLKAMGYTHMPCIVQHISRKEEFNITTLSNFPPEVLKDITESPRPALLKDFFDPSLMKEVKLPAKVRSVRLIWNVEQVDTPAG